MRHFSQTKLKFISIIPLFDLLRILNKSKQKKIFCCMLFTIKRPETFLQKLENGKYKRALNPGNSQNRNFGLNPNLFFPPSLLRTAVANQRPRTTFLTAESHIITMKITHLFLTHTHTFAPQYNRKSRVKPGKDVKHKRLARLDQKITRLT